MKTIFKIQSIQKRVTRIIFPLMNYNEALNALNLTALCERHAHLCQVYIDRLQNENHPLHLVLPKWILNRITMSDPVLAVSRVLLVELYGLYRYVPRNREWFLRFSVLK